MGEKAQNCTQRESGWRNGTGGNVGEFPIEYHIVSRAVVESEGACVPPGTRSEDISRISALNWRV
jgi:hypothetical protein